MAVWAKASLTMMALVENRIAPQRVMIKPRSLGDAFCMAKEQGSLPEEASVLEV
jgi:hypothetical protein